MKIRKELLVLPLFLVGALAIGTMVFGGDFGSATLVNANELVYGITFNSGKNKLFAGTGATDYSGDATIKTNLGNNIQFSYSKVAGGAASAWHLVKNGGSFGNDDPIHGMQTLSVNCSSAGKNFRISWGYDSSCDLGSKDYVSTENATICDFNGDNPAYFTFENTGDGFLTITSMEIALSCINDRPVLTAISNSEAMGTVSGGGVKTAGQSVTVSATPALEHTFIGWYNENDNLVSNDNPYTFVMPYDDVHLTGKFALNTYSVTATVNDESMGSTTGAGVYGYGQSVTLYAIPKSHHTFVGWYSNDELVFSSISWTFDMPNEPLSYEARFVRNYNINAVSESSEKGWVWAQSECGAGLEVTIYANPKEGWAFDCWLDENYEEVSFDRAYTFVMPANDVELTATFFNEYTVRYCNFDGTLLYETHVSVGEDPVYSGDQPVKPDSEETAYLFSDWVLQSNRHGVLVYQAVYDSCTAGLEIEDGTVRGYHGTASDVVIPESWGGSKIIAIDYNAFSGCSRLVSVEIPSGVMFIYDSAFRGCTSLVSVEIPSSVIHIGSGTFRYCSSLESIEIRASLGRISDSIFEGCSSLLSVEIPSGVNEIGSYAFSKCSSLASVNLPESLVTIGDYAFQNCSSLDSINIGSSVTSIGEYAFCGCSLLASVNLPNSLVTVGRCSFAGCSSLISINIPRSLTSIGDYAFTDCSSLSNITVHPLNNIYDSREDCNAIIRTSLNALIVGCMNTWIPNSVKSIGNDAFSGNTSLESLDIPSGVTTIGDYAFRNCSSLKTIDIPDSVTSIGNSAFSGCSSLASVEIPSGVTTIDSYAFDGCSSLASVEIPSGVTTIGWYAFDGCSSLASVEIPSGVTTIGGYAFSGCSSLASVEIPSGVTIIDRSTFSGCSSLASIEIPSGVAAIRDSAFNGCSSLVSIEIPANVASIGGSVLGGCTSLSSISVDQGNAKYDSRDGCNAIIATETNELIAGCKETVIPDSVVSIGFDAFSKCSSLVSIEIPDSVTSIKGGAFSGCSSLASIGIPANAASIGARAFSDCSSLASVEIPSGVTIIDRFTFSGCSSLASIEIPSGVAAIRDFAFNGCSSLVSIEIPANVASIGGYAFDGCSSLASIEIPANVASIGEWAFRGCASLSSISVDQGNAKYDSRDGCNAIIATETNELIAGCKETVIPDSVVSIGFGAFSKCSSLTSIEIPSGVTTIGSYAFYGCNLLTSIVIPSGVTIISDSSFEGCSSLTSIEIPASVTSIYGNAFSGCKSLSSVYYAGDAQSWSNITIRKYGNDELTNTTRYYYSETEPAAPGNYWHYVEGVPTPW